MPRNIDPVNQVALEKRALSVADFLTVWAKDRVTGDPVIDCMWSGVYSGTFSVYNPDTNLPVERTFEGVGSLVEISDIPLVSNLSVQTINIKLNNVIDKVQDLIRLYDVKQARIEVHRGLFNTETRRPVAPAECRFVGFVDTLEIRTPSENDEGGVFLTCTSHTQEMTRWNPDTRSHESQQVRAPGDTFYTYANVVAEWNHDWGKAAAGTETKKGLLGWGGWFFGL